MIECMDAWMEAGPRVHSKTNWPVELSRTGTAVYWKKALTKPFFEGCPRKQQSGSIFAIDSLLPSLIKRKL